MPFTFEMKVAYFKAKGYSNAEIAAVLGVPESRVVNAGKVSDAEGKVTRANWNRQKYLTIARQLGYPAPVLAKLKHASSGIEADRIMTTARHDAIEKEKGKAWN